MTIRLADKEMEMGKGIRNSACKKHSGEKNKIIRKDLFPLVRF